MRSALGTAGHRSTSHLHACPSGKKFDVDHAVSCIKRGFVYRRHDEVRDLFSSILKDVCHDVEVEPHLQTLTAEKFNQQCQLL